MISKSQHDVDPLFFFGNSLAGEICKTMDWSSSYLGSPDRWPDELKLTLAMIYNNPHPMSLFWGPDHIYFYNDGYIPIVGQSKHPWAVGKKASEVWKEVWEVVESQINEVMTGGKTWNEDQLVPVLGDDGMPREAYFTYSYSPVYLMSGEVGGVMVTCTETTKRKQFENALKQGQSSLEQALSSAQMGTWKVDIEANIVTLSQEARNILGFSKESEDIDVTIDALIHPDDREHAKEVLAETIRSGGAYSDVYRIVRPDGETRWINSLGRAHHHLGKIIALSGLIMDITEQRRLTEELEFRNQLNQTITDNTASCLFMVDKQGHPTFMNPSAMAITGYSSLDEIKDKPLHYAIHWKRPDGSLYPMEECPIDNTQAELKKVQNQEEVFCSKDGRLFPVSYSITRLEKNGKVMGSVLEFRDITEQKRIEEKLHQSLSILSTINEVGQKLTAELELDKLVQQVTDAATKLTGAQFGAFFYNSVDEQGRMMLLNVVSGAPREAFSKFPNPRATQIFHPTFIGAGTVRSANITQDPRYGKNSPYKGIPEGHLPVKSYLAVSVVSRTGEVIGGLFFGHEKENIFSEQAEKIAEGLASQAAVAVDNARLYREVHESVKARDEFLSIASHELKTPLTSLKMQTQMRMRRLSKNDLSFFNAEKLHDIFEKDAHQIERLSRLIDDMLDISRISTGKLSIHPEYFDLRSLVKDVIERCSTQIEESHTTIDLISNEDVFGFWDRFRIEQVVTNLLTNALRYGGHKPIQVSIWKEENEFVFVKVKDQGIGIAEENRQRIFERFERAIPATEISGLGLGLYIVKQIVEMHGGSIEVKSEVGQGSEFIVRLPLNHLRIS